jgi:dienelactone hydrolase
MAIAHRAPRGDLKTYTRDHFTTQGMAHDVYKKGSGPAVLIITEMPGISPQVLGFADRVVALGCTAVLPDLFGEAGRDPDAGSLPARAAYLARSLASICISREFTLFAAGATAGVIGWLRKLAELEHERCGGPGVGVIGMCFSGGFALAMATDPRVLVPVLSQPSQPAALSARARRAIDCDERDLRLVAGRCARDGLRVLGLRFEGDPFVPPERFEFLRERLGAGFISVELAQADGHPDSPMLRHHSVLTRDLIDDPGQPTRAALDQVLTMLRGKLLGMPVGMRSGSAV